MKFQRTLVKKLLICLISLVLVKYGFAQDPVVININTQLINNSDLKCSHFIKELTYIPLETNESCLMNKVQYFEILKENLIVQAPRECLIFDINTGKFKNRIGTVGRGPGEYRHTIGLVNHISNEIFFKGWSNNLLSYDLDNNFLNSFKIPFANKDFNNPSFPTTFFSNNTDIYCYFSNITGTQDKLFVTIDWEKKELGTTIPNRNTVDNASFVMVSNETDYYSFAGDAFFKELYNDTVFKLAKNNLQPHIIINSGKYHFSYEMKWTHKVFSQEHILPRNLYESNNFFGFDFFFNGTRNWGVFSKKNNSLLICKNNDGIINDLDGFVSFAPLHSNGNGILYGLIDAYKIVEWFNENPEKASKLPQHLQDLKNIKETDNPIIMIAKLK